MQCVRAWATEPNRTEPESIVRLKIAEAKETTKGKSRFGGGGVDLVTGSKERKGCLWDGLGEGGGLVEEFMGWGRGGRIWLIWVFGSCEDGEARARARWQLVVGDGEVGWVHGGGGLGLGVGGGGWGLWEECKGERGKGKGGACSEECGKREREGRLLWMGRWVKGEGWVMGSLGKLGDGEVWVLRGFGRRGLRAVAGEGREREGGGSWLWETEREGEGRVPVVRNVGEREGEGHHIK
ncbi:hypothetical protein Acr_19g0010380 [Actinidia rufa]|uniref:Uncharacterized protein n=1 Tax=Actinidia rufa TaxID=165716 RepID=A0A7J0GBG8_9ERIC|nr:hypothetical protein Acr_19g0010380 [Actinidia rufa]